MPTIYEYFGLIFMIHTADHLPINVHVLYGKQESIIEIVRNPAGQVIEVRKRKGTSPRDLDSKQLKTAMKFINAKAEEIVTKWKLIMENKYTGSPTRIKRKIV